MPSGRLIAADALAYAGAGYVFGGAADRPGNWDCSSFVSYVLGHDLGMLLPGGGHYGDAAYPPHYHGPVVTSYAGWGGAAPLPAGQPPAAGDLCIWNGIGANGHIGFAVDASTMISALNHVSGTVHTPIAGYGPAGVPVQFRRLADVGQVPGSPAAGGTGTASDVLFAMLAGATLPVIMSAVILGLAALGSIAAAGALLWVLTRRSELRAHYAHARARPQPLLEG
jgi:hypothetical protein